MYLILNIITDCSDVNEGEKFFFFFEYFSRESRICSRENMEIVPSGNMNRDIPNGTRICT